MQFCQSHWDKLREAVKECGMDELVASGGKEVINRMEKELKGDKSLSSFDPLMSVHWVIVNRLAELGGGEIFLMEGCPMCFANSGHQKGCKEPNCIWSYDDWIPDAVDDVRDYAIELGWKREVD